MAWWLALLVPPKPARQLRDFTRTCTVFIQERTRHKHHVDKVLQDARIKPSGAISDLFGLSRRAMMNAMVAGEHTPRTFAEFAPRPAQPSGAAREMPDPSGVWSGSPRSTAGA